MLRRIAVVGVEGDKRVTALQAAAARVGLHPLRIVPWASVLECPDLLRAATAPGDIVRVESPGSDAETFHAFATLGGALASDAPSTQWRPRRAWMRGLTLALERIEASCEGRVLTHRAADVVLMTDKLCCAQRLESEGLPSPRTEEAPQDVQTLRRMVDAWPRRAVFVKSRWGSSAAGVFAYRRENGRERLVTTTRLESGVPFQHKRPWVYDRADEIDALLAPVLADGAIVQSWIPKAGTAEGAFDLRVLVLGGRVAHRVARVGRSTITNLHLGARRLEVEEALGGFPRAWGRVEEVCLRVASCFDPGAMVALDVGLDPRGRVFVIEINAWGDYLPGLLHSGLDAYERQFRDLAQRTLPEAA